MKSSNRSALSFAGAALAALMVIGAATAQNTTGYQSLRGAAPVSDADLAAPIAKLETPQHGFARAYRQQPPLVPHKIDGYQVTVSNNQCMDCHDYPNNFKYGATKISETHYQDRAGARLDKVAGTRYFCTGCHVPQTDAKPLVVNTFTDATGK